MVSDKEMKDIFKNLDRVVPDKSFVDKTHARVEDYLQKKRTDELVTIEPAEKEVSSLKSVRKSSRRYAAILIIAIVSSVLLFAVFKDNIIGVFRPDPTPTVIPSPTPKEEKTTETIELYSTDNTLLVCVADFSENPKVKLEIGLVDKEYNKIEGTDYLTLWISKGNYDRKPFDGIEWCGTSYIALVGAEKEYDDIAPTKAPGTQEPVTIWYLSSAGEWKEWKTEFTGLSGNTYDVNFKKETATYDNFTLEKCYIELADYEGKRVYYSKFPVIDDKYLRLEAILDTTYSDNFTEFENGGIDLEPYITLRQDKEGNFVYYSPALSAEYIVEYYGKDKQSNNIMIVRRLAAHVIGADSMYFSTFDNDNKLIGKYHFEPGDISDFKVFEYEGEIYYAYAREFFGQSYRKCAFRIFQFKNNEWVNYTEWDESLRAVLKEDHVEVYRVDTTKSGAEPEYVRSLTYAEILEEENIQME